MGRGEKQAPLKTPAWEATLRDSVGRYMREIIIAMFLQIQSDIYIYNAVVSFYPWFRSLFLFLWYGNL